MVAPWKGVAKSRCLMMPADCEIWLCYTQAMPSYSADLHLHSRFAYACSKNLTLENLAAWARIKGIQLLASGDFTHPAWRAELGRKLEPDGQGLFAYNGAHFVLGTEVSCVYSQGGKVRRVHLLLLAPDFPAVDRISQALAGMKNNLESDGRPTLGMSARDFMALALDVNPDCIVIPAHVWTPWYGAFGSKTGFADLEECFHDMAIHVHAIETGLSSDPAMNWRVPWLEDKAIVSFSDAHSPPKLGREFTVFHGELSYLGLAESLAQNQVAYTVEFYPEEGKYHYTGHRKCGVRHSPDDTAAYGPDCPKCGRTLTLGVLHRIEGMSAGPARETCGSDGFVRHEEKRPPFIRLLPLVEIIAGVANIGPSSKRVQAEYLRLTQEFGSEIQVLMSAEVGELSRVAGEPLAQAVLQARTGDVDIRPGFDGEYGRVSLGRLTASPGAAG